MNSIGEQRLTEMLSEVATAGVGDEELVVSAPSWRRIGRRRRTWVAGKAGVGVVAASGLVVGGLWATGRLPVGSDRLMPAGGAVQTYPGSSVAPTATLQAWSDYLTWPQSVIGTGQDHFIALHGYAGVTWSDDDLTVTFWWKGQAPKDYLKKMSDPPPGVTSVVRTDARYSYAELEPIVQRMKQTGGWDPDIDVLPRPSDDGSGITLTWSRLGDADKSETYYEGEIRQRAAELTDLPIRLERI